MNEILAVLIFGGCDNKNSLNRLQISFSLNNSLHFFKKWSCNQLMETTLVKIVENDV